MEHRAETSFFHLTRFWASFFISLQVLPIRLASSSIVLRHVFFGLPLLLLPTGFHSKHFWAMSCDGLLRVWPIQDHFLLFNVISIGSWLHFVHRSLLEITFGHHTPNILLKHLLTKVWSLDVNWVSNFQVSDPYNKIDFTFELKSLILLFSLMLCDLHMFFKLLKAHWALPILLLISASTPPSLPTTLPR